jgi:hypothetical protein
MGPAAASILDNISFAGSLDANLVSLLTEFYQFKIEVRNQNLMVIRILLITNLKTMNIPFASQRVCQDWGPVR